MKPVPTAGQGQILDDINAIRNRLGGGVGETLKGMFPEPGGSIVGESAQAMFDESLKQLTGAQPTQATNTKSLQLGLGNGSIPQPGSSLTRLSAPSPDALSPQSQKLATFRGAARKLDEAAADLEDVGAYDLADQIREQARALRQMARQWNRNG